MNKKIFSIVSLLTIVLLVGSAFYFSKNKSTEVVYKNTQYSFEVTLPLSWKGYSEVSDKWEGYSLTATSSQGQVITETGPLIYVRNPLWTKENPRQDIPVMVFTLKQWSDMQTDKFHIGAAPINPSELARNSQYVLALPARYNFAYLVGYEEVDQIIKGGGVKSF